MEWNHSKIKCQNPNEFLTERLFTHCLHMDIKYSLATLTMKKVFKYYIWVASTIFSYHVPHFAVNNCPLIPFSSTNRSYCKDIITYFRRVRWPIEQKSYWKTPINLDAENSLLPRWVRFWNTCHDTNYWSR